MSEIYMDGQSIGARLKAEREKKALELEDAALVTRISKGYLAALEADDYSKLPSDFHARGFLRAYARFLGMDEQDIRLPESSAEQAPDEEAASRDTAEIRKSGGPCRIGFFAVIAAVCIVAGATVVFLSEREKKPENKAETPLSVPPVAGIYSSPRLTVATDVPKIQPQPDSSPPNGDIPPPPAPSAPGTGLVLKMKALEDGFLVVTIDDTVSQQYDLKAGDVIEWKAEKFFSLDLDNAGGVEAELNGRVLKPFGERGASAHVVLKTDNQGDETAP